MALPQEGPNEFEVARKRAQQQNNAALQGQQDAIKRRFAALGSVNSGAAIKQNQLAAENAQRQISDDTERIDAAERAENARKAEVEAGRQFAREERLGGQDFAGQQAELGRKFQTSERLGGQDFAGQQGALAREFARQERLGGQEFQGSQNAMQRALAEAQMRQQESQFGRQLSQQDSQFGRSQDFARSEAERAREHQAHWTNAQMEAAKSQFDATQRQQADQFAQQLGFSQEQFAEEKFINRENLAMAKQMLNEKDFLEGILSGDISSIPGGGFISDLGSGIAAKTGMSGEKLGAVGGAITGTGIVSGAMIGKGSFSKR